MKIIYVKFLPSSKPYAYMSNLPFVKNGIYDIIADGVTTYSSYVQVLDIQDYKHRPQNIVLREITSAKVIQMPPKPDGGVSKVISNEAKGTTVIIWKDGTKTIVKCQDGEPFDAEKGIALCFMKKAYDNRGCYNDVFKILGEADEIYCK